MAESMERQQQNPRGHCNTFSEEILEKIFLSLDDGKVLKAVSDASSQFNRILAPSKTEWAFSQVFPQIYAELDKEDILNCRLVGRQWKKSVDDFLPTVPTDRFMEPYPNQSGQRSSDSKTGNIMNRNDPPHAPQYLPNRVSKDLTYTYFRRTDLIRRFVAEMNPHTMNPFILRDASFNNYEDEDEAYWTEVLTFLKIFGHHIWNASLGPTSFPNPNRPARLCGNYRILRAALSLMPNLKTLTVFGFQTEPFGLDADARLLACMTRYIGRRPLPELPHLRTLHEFLPQQPNPVMDELMRRYSNQLNSLETSISVWMKEGCNFDDLPQVTYLHLNFDACYCTWRSFCRSVEAPNLAKLSLNIQNDWRISKLLKPLMKYFPSLIYLSLKFRVKNEKLERNGQPKFLLEKIKTLEIEDSSNVPYAQLISYLPCLEYVLVCHDPCPCCRPRVQEVEEQVAEPNEELEAAGPDEMETEEMEEESRVLEIGGIRKSILSGRMYQSDIWTRLKFLKEFTFARMGNTGDTECEIAEKIQYTRDVYILKSGQGK